MPRSVRFHPLAAQEAAAVSDWYRERSQQAAIGFVAELDHAVQQVTELPETWPSYERVRDAACFLFIPTPLSTE